MNAAAAPARQGDEVDPLLLQEHQSLGSSDVLDDFKEIKVCTKYTKNGVVTDEMPYDTEGWEAVYETLPGWQTDLTQMTSESQFPKELKDYIAYIEKATGTPITIISVGPDRAQTITR